MALVAIPEANGREEAEAPRAQRDKEKANSRTRPNPFKLINCEQYCQDTGNHDATSNQPPPFRVLISVEAIAIIDVHAHCVQTEVIGLLGGLYCSRLRQLVVSLAEPCRSITANTTDLQCEMDPVSQAEAMEKITSSGQLVIGWYHSHPTFVPNPSLRDIETQQEYQTMFMKGDMPFLAMILSPYSGSCNPTHKHTLISKFKCLMVNEDADREQGEHPIPYEFVPNIVRMDKLRVNLVEKVRVLCEYLNGRKTSLCMIDRIRGKDLLLVNKLAASMKHYMETAGLSSREADYLIDIVKELVQEHLSSKNK